MNLLSEIISKPVLNLYSGKIEGTISSVIFDESYKKIQSLKVFDEEEEEYCLFTSKIYSVGKNSIVIKNSEALSLCLNELDTKENNPINLDVYTTCGDHLGKLIDIELNDKFQVENFLTSDQKIPHKKLINIGNSLIINTTEKKVNLSNLKPKINKNNVKPNNVISILPKIEEPTLEQAEPTKKLYKISTEAVPQKVVGNSNFLIGRKALKTIYGLNHEIIIKKDNLINAKNLETAKKHSKLVELTVFSKIKA